MTKSNLLNEYGVTGVNSCCKNDFNATMLHEAITYVYVLIVSSAFSTDAQ